MALEASQIPSPSPRPPPLYSYKSVENQITCKIKERKVIVRVALEAYSSANFSLFIRCYWSLHVHQNIMYLVSVNSTKVCAAGKFWQYNLLAKERVQTFILGKSNSYKFESTNKTVYKGSSVHSLITSWAWWPLTISGKLSCVCPSRNLFQQPERRFYISKVHQAYINISKINTKVFTPICKLNVFSFLSFCSPLILLPVLNPCC